MRAIGHGSTRVDWERVLLTRFVSHGDAVVENESEAPSTEQQHDARHDHCRDDGDCIVLGERRLRKEHFQDRKPFDHHQHRQGCEADRCPPHGTSAFRLPEGNVAGVDQRPAPRVELLLDRAEADDERHEPYDDENSPVDKTYTEYQSNHLNRFEQSGRSVLLDGL